VSEERVLSGGTYRLQDLPLLYVNLEHDVLAASDKKLTLIFPYETHALEVSHRLFSGP
jgi:hypothetical protein